MSAEHDVFAQIREGAAGVARQSRSVRLVETTIAPYAESLAREGLPLPEYDTEHHIRGSDAETVAFLLALDAINFGSGYFPHLRKRPGMSGYFTVASSLKDRWQQSPLVAAELRALTPADCAVIFGQADNPGPAQELMALFAQALNDLGLWLGDRYNDDPLGPIDDARGSAARLVGLVTVMPLFRDVSRYRDYDVPFYKRAQILVTDLAMAFAEKGAGRFYDLDQLTIFADNLVPHVLRVDGLLDYDPELLARIERGELIPAGSPEEVEIRALAIHTVERLVETLRSTGIPATARQLDYILWNRGQEDIYKQIPRHRTRTVFY
jgi:hypothetical protein